MVKKNANTLSPTLLFHSHSSHTKKKKDEEEEVFPVKNKIKNQIKGFIKLGDIRNCELVVFPDVISGDFDTSKIRLHTQIGKS